MFSHRHSVKAFLDYFSVAYYLQQANVYQVFCYVVLQLPLKNLAQF